MGLFLTTDAAGAAASANTLVIIAIYVVLFGFLYFVMIRPQRKEQKQKAQTLASLAVGDSVRTTGGFVGVILDITDDMVIVEFGNNKNCRIPMYKEAIVEVEKPEDAVASNTETSDSKKK
ncbi:preprotein translocase subunit YajC [Butyrivibrio sp. YAB3001]|uniref:preprotein translocase subunit YajC n=1 Tax=Butyrivibrio sp. YAB3001 TaxID=1520812 RepID=UPI0008F65ABC|nr:preprotein translocase subunit YajC [Butyrivibrio sp. YAB3001]SFB66551.1 preprotein translocase subunit YajC [Butyrivibrio sp. YAB3001]